MAGALATGTGYALAAGFARDLTGKPADLTAPMDPAELLEQDRRIFGRLWIAVGAAFRLCCGVGQLVHVGLTYGLGGTTTGHAIAIRPAHILDRRLAQGITVGLAGALSHNAWWYYTVTRHHLAVRRQLPRDLAEFLTDALERRGALRRMGEAHRFRHLAAPAPAVPLPRPRIPGRPVVHDRTGHVTHEGRGTGGRL
ncbi:hypothetical protein ACI2L1_32845 [Streptomyces sp. NPDC019531]|uniref:hypothetical protein n=1 Tax=Streptomyces sp. NPDC019531 TaxID=3365062 RepID=UPI00384C792C